MLVAERRPEGTSVLVGRSLRWWHGPCCNLRGQAKLLDGGIKERTLVARAHWAGQGLVFMSSSVSSYVLNASVFKESLNLLFGVLIEHSFGG